MRISLARISAAFTLCTLAVAGCVDSDSVAPPADRDAAPLFEAIENAIQETEGFYFLPPLAVKNPSTVGTFNPNLAPGMFVCELSQLGQSGSCVGSRLADFAPGSFSVDAINEQYVLSWDTNGPETTKLNPNKDYRLNVTVGDQIVGSIDLDPQNPNGPGQSTADAYAFRVGETIPVKVWMSLEILCQGEGFVVECITGAVIDQTGASLALTNKSPRLGLDVAPYSLPNTIPSVVVVLERIDPSVYRQPPPTGAGEECIPLFDAPQFGSCFRITTYPELPAGSLSKPAVVSICEDTGAFVGLTPEQEGTLNMVRYNLSSSGTPQWEALQDTVGNCGTIQSAGLVPVPDGGLARFAALGLNKVAELLLPQPLYAFREIRLGGFTSSFSNFRFALPGVMVPTDGVGVVIQQSDPNVIDASVTVLDYEGNPVQGATVHFTTSDGSPSPADAVSGTDGVARTLWTVDVTDPGTKTLTASALGLVANGAPDEQNNAGFLMTDSVTIDVTVVGPPSTITPSPTDTLSGTAGQTVGDLTITVEDEAHNPIVGASVTWTGDGSVSGGTTTGPDGSATGSWTLPITAGNNTVNTVTATVGGISATFTATGAAGPAVAPTYSAVPSSGTAGLALPAITVTVLDQYDNPRSGDAVSWTVTSGGGKVSPTSNTTAADGTASAIWTLGDTVRSNVLTVTVPGIDDQIFTQTFTVAGTVGAAVEPTVTTGDGQTGIVGQPLADPLTVLVTDQFGNPRAGDVVTWEVGDVSTDVVTDASGVSSFPMTLDTVAGTQTATATLGTFPPIGFTATANPGAPANLAYSGALGTHLVGSALSNLRITVTDTYNNRVDGAAVDWKPTLGGGAITGDALTADGIATAVWTLGAAPGANSATAVVGGLSATFTATGVCFDGYGVTQVDGVFNASEWACASSQGFSANISGGSVPATVYWQNDGTNLYFAVVVPQSSLDKVNTLRIDFDNNNNGVAERNDDAIGYVGETGTFFDQYLTAKCENRSQSGCGDDDPPTLDGSGLDGSGAVGNDGTHTVFELAHPLNTGQATDISVGTGDIFGFFLTLQSGNGAQGNTQVPGFRSYIDFTVVGN